ILLDYPDGELPWLPMTQVASLEAEIGHAILRLSPEVVITFAEDGLYWHPDHIAVHEQTTAVVASLGDKSPALYYVTMPEGQARAIADTVARQSPEGRDHLKIFG